MAFQVSQVCQQDRQQAFLEWLPAYLVVVTMASGRICWRRRCRPGAGWMTCFWGVDFKWWDLKFCEMKSLVIFSGRWNEVDFLEYLKPRPKGSATLPEQDSVVEIPFTRWDLDMWALQCWKSLSNSCAIILYEKLAAPQNTHMSTSPLSWNATCCHSSQHPLTFFVQDVEDVLGQRFFFPRYYSSDPDAPGKTYAKHGGFIEGAELFDPSCFGLSPAEAAAIDPQQRLLFLAVWSFLICREKDLFSFFFFFMILVKGEEKVGSPLSIPLFLICNGSFCTSQCGCMISSGTLLEGWIGLFFEMESRSLNPCQVYMKL